jgi:ribosome maturation factor RimP
VVSLLGPVAAAAHLDLEDVEVRSAGRRRIVRVLVDGERGVSLDQVAEVSRAVADALDESDVLGDTPYTLEVSSPGVDRPLALPRHWRRNVGRLVVVHSGGTDLTGRISSADDEGVELDLEPGLRRLPYGTISRAVVQVEFRSVADVEDLEDLGDDDQADDAAPEA